MPRRFAKKNPPHTLRDFSTLLRDQRPGKAGVENFRKKSLPAFQRIADDLPVAPLLAMIDANPHWWLDETMRQDFLGSAHYATQCIYVRGPAGFTVEEYFGEPTAFDYPRLPELFPVLMPVLRPVLTTLAFTELGRVLIVRLPAGASLTEHIDQGAYAEHYARFHVVLSANPDCALVVEGQAQHMAPGEAWWFDHQRTHYAHNQGETDRVHLILDAVSPRFERAPHARAGYD